MRVEDIKDKIDKNNMEIESLLTPNVFTLNARVNDLMRENILLRESCEHEYKDGFCIWCYKKED